MHTIQDTTEEDTGTVMMTRSHPLLCKNKATVATTLLTLARAVVTNATAFTETVTMAAAALEDMAEEELLSQVHSTAITLIPQVDSPIVSLKIQQL